MSGPSTDIGAAYVKKYGSLDVRGDLSDVFGDGSSKHRRPLVTREPRVIITGADPSVVKISSFDPAYITFLEKLADNINAELQPELDERGFTLNGMHSPADNLACVAGFMMNPMTYTAFSNAAYREYLGLKPKYDARERKIAENVWRLVFSEWIPSDVRVPQKSSSGVPRFTSDHVWKKEFALYLFEPANLERCLSLIEKGDRRALASEFEMIWMTYIQTRLQTESIKKKREVMDREYATTNGKSGRLFPADKKVVINGRHYPRMSAMRARVIQAGPWSINCLLQVVFSGTLQSMFSRWPTLFHVTEPEQLSEVLDGKFIFAGDVKEYDRSMSEDAIRVMHEMMAEFWDPRLAKASLDLMFAPYYCRPLELSGTRGTFFGNPFDPESTVIAGNKSGHASTSVGAKVNKVIDDLLVFDKMYGDVLGNEDAYMRGNRVIGVLNNGDDHVVYSESEAAIELFRTMRKDPENGHYIVEEEVGQVFSGYVLMKKPTEPGQAPSYVAYRRLLTFAERLFCPERSAGSFLRRFWPIGAYDRIVNADKVNPLGGQVLEIIMRTYRDELGPTHGDLMNLIKEALHGLPVRFHSLNAASLEVLDDPEKIHYKYLDSDIDPDVLAQIQSKIPKEAIIHIGERYYHGSIREAIH